MDISTTSARQRLLCSTILLFIVSFLVAIGCQHKHQDNDSEILYFLTFSSVADSPVEANSITVGGGPLGGDIVISINQCPIRVIRTGGFMESINEWLHSGTNTIELQGSHDVPLFVNVYKAHKSVYESSGKIEKILAHGRMKPSSGLFHLHFECKLSWDTPDLGEIALDESDKNRLNEKVENLIDLLKLQMETRNDDTQFKQSMLYGMKHWGDAYGLTQRHFDALNNEIATEFLTGGTQLLQNGNIRIEYDRKGVYVWRGMNKSGRPFLWEMKSKNGRSEFPPLIFVKCNGELRIWNRW